MPKNGFAIRTSTSQLSWEATWTDGTLALCIVKACGPDVAKININPSSGRYIHSTQKNPKGVRLINFVGNEARNKATMTMVKGGITYVINVTMTVITGENHIVTHMSVTGGAFDAPAGKRQ